MPYVIHKIFSYLAKLSQTGVKIVALEKEKRAAAATALVNPKVAGTKQNVENDPEVGSTVSAVATKNTVTGVSVASVVTGIGTETVIGIGLSIADVNVPNCLLYYKFR